MNIAELSIKRPIFITCIFILILTLGGISLSKIGLDLFPDITFPIASVVTYYPGASPAEVEVDVSKIMEDELGSISGLENMYSNNKDGVSIITCQFTLETDIKYAQQQIRDKISAIRSKLPDDIKEPIVRIADPSDSPVAIVSVSANLDDAKMYDLVEYTIKQKLEQADNVGRVDIVGGRKREFHVDLDKNKLKSRELSASMVSYQVGLAGKNIPSGNIQGKEKDLSIRSLAEFKSIDDIESTIVSFVGNDIPITVKDLGKVSESLTDEDSRSFVDGKKALIVLVYKQSDTNTVSVVNGVKKKINELNTIISSMDGNPKITMVQDSSWPITANIKDVLETIFIGILLTILVVYLALGSGRSTFITSVALPNSLLGSFILMIIAGFTMNVITLLALSLAVGLLIDDAIVVRENIFRHLEMGEKPKDAALKGTKEVMLAVIATTLVIIAVFAPVSFLTGVVGRFFKSFGLTVCFVMAISLLDALTMAPMMSAYLAGKQEHKEKKNWLLEKFSKWQDSLEEFYERTLLYTLKNNKKVILISLGVFLVTFSTIIWIPKSFKQAADNGEFLVYLKAAPGTSLEQSQQYAEAVDKIITQNKKLVALTVFFIGADTEDANEISLYVKMVDRKHRNVSTTKFKEMLRKQVKDYAFLNPIFSDTVGNFGSKQPFLLYVRGDDLKELKKISDQLMARLKNHPSLKDVNTSYEEGKPEFQIVFDKRKSEMLGVSNNMAGMELRTFVEGQTPTKFKINDNNYDVRVRLQENQRDMRKIFSSSYVPNINNRLIPLNKVAQGVETTGPSEINRLDRARYILISADIAPKGPGMSKAIQDIEKMFKNEIKMPAGYNYKLEGQAKTFGELVSSMLMAAAIGITFIYLILASLYESFIIPFTIMLVLPMSLCGAFLALFITGQSLDLFSMIGCIMLLGVATKNSIILVDYTHKLMDQGMERSAAIVKAGKTRLRPILMTSFALLGGMTPLAFGLSELSSFRQGMGIAVMGGVISSTILSLIVIPASFSSIDNFRVWIATKLKKKFGHN
ncbi:MAG: efflux RND transporter permease subunit [Proteobacteria bacterium]|nr:efflux RND transporter permease subunit [Pseudomonadota bacterium]